METIKVDMIKLTVYLNRSARSIPIGTNFNINLNLFARSKFAFGRSNGLRFLFPPSLSSLPFFFNRFNSNNHFFLFLRLFVFFNYVSLNISFYSIDDYRNREIGFLSMVTFSLYNYYYYY